MTDRKHVVTILVSKWAQKEAEWAANGWQMASFATFGNGPDRMTRVVLVKEY